MGEEGVTLDVSERVGPFVVVANEATIPARKRRVVVRCVVCERVSEMNERSLLDKRTEEQRACAKCRVYTTNGTWVKGWRAKMENAAAEANRLNEENARLRDEIDKVMRERDEWRDKFHALNQTAGELCNACGWAFKIPGESCRCEVIKERDEARAEAARLRRLLNMAEDELIAADDHGRREANRADTIEAEVEALKAERDEARAEVEHAYREGGALYEAKIAEREAFRCGAEAMRVRCEEIARHACSVIGKLEHTYGIMTQGHIETVSRLILETDIPEEP